MNDTMTTSEPIQDDLLDGADAFVEFTGFRKRRVFYLLEKGLLPAGKLGGKWIGSKAAVRRALTRIASGQPAGDEAA